MQFDLIPILAVDGGYKEVILTPSGTAPLPPAAILAAAAMIGNNSAGTLYYTMDGGSASNQNGIPIKAGDTLYLTNRNQIDQISLRNGGASSAVVAIQYFKTKP